VRIVMLDVEDCPFSFRDGRGGKVFIYWRGREVTVLKGQKAQAFLQRISELDESGRQLVMAKATGNFKRGTESREP
jgi:hypothetical protein